jgi:hypothetical protein
MMGIIKKTGLFVLVSLVFFSCKKTEFVGEEIVSTSDGFSVSGFSFSNEEVAFDESHVYFSSSFSEEATAKVVLVGEESGARKTFIYNYQSELNQDNSIWKGEHDGLTFFRKNETVIATLSFYGHAQKYLDTIRILEPINYSNKDGVFVYSNSGVEELSSWNSWSPQQYGEKINQELSGRSDFVLPVQGEYSYRLLSKEEQSKGYIGGGDFNVKGNQNGFVYLSDQANEVWFNCYVYSAKESAGVILISFAEADNLEKSDSETTDKVNLVIPLDLVGWKLISKQYIKIPFATNPIYGGNGNTIYEPNKIDVIAFQIESSQDDELIDVAFDNFIFTVGEPFNN